MLTPRQELILRKVVEDYLEGGQPVGSKALATDVELEWGPSTIRNELAMLEEHGLLAHPHTSAGRVPTDAGYRYFVDRLLPTRRRAGRAPARALARAARGRRGDARHDRDALAGHEPARDRLRAADRDGDDPPRRGAAAAAAGADGRRHHLDRRRLEADADVRRRRSTPASPTGAASYLNEQLVGLGLGARLLHQRLDDPSLGPRERGFLAAVAPAFTELTETAEESLYVDGARAARRAATASRTTQQLNEVMEMLERRVSLLGVLRSALDQRDVYVRIGSENEAPALRSLALVAAGYGLPARNLGTVSVIGPLRMDYARAIASVRAAAIELSRFVEDVYEA